MKPYSLSHLADCTLLRELAALVRQDHSTTATLLAHIADVDERKLYLPAAHSSMYSYCVRELRMSEDMAYKRITAARVARRFTAILPALADGRIHLSGVVMLAPHLTPDTADELLAAATHKTKSEIELLLAERFPRPDAPTTVRAFAQPIAPEVLAVTQRSAPVLELAPGRVVPLIALNGPVQMDPLAPRAKLSPLSPERFEWHLTVDKETQEQLRYAQALLGHVVPSGDVAQVLKRALGSLVRELEKQKFAKSARSRPRSRGSNGRSIPAEVRRTVWQRDQGQCTFVSGRGKRCDARESLEFDHVDPVARGGRSAVAGVRLLCRAHNQYAAECAFDTEFMRGKRERTRDGMGRSSSLLPAIDAPAPPA